MASTTFTTRALTAALLTLLAWAATPLTTKAQLPDYLPTEGLVGWWPFNGNANDESGNGNDGTVNGATLTEDRDGNQNAAYSFDGVDDFIQISYFPSLPSVGADFSMSIWYLMEDLPGSGSSCVIDDNSAIAGCWYSGGFPGANQWLLHVAYPGFLTAVSLESPSEQLTTLSGSTIVETGAWVNTVLVRENNQVMVYSNGIQDIEDEFIDPVFYDLELDFLIGTMGRAIDGAVCNLFSEMKADDIAIYNRALTPEEITALYTGIPYVAPCADPTACNFEQEGECVFAEPNLDCAGNCLNDCNNNGVCDEVEVYGCKYPTACNYNPEATSDDDSCTFPAPNYDCAGNCLLDLNNNGLCDLEEVAGCTNIDAINFDASATLDNGTCMVTCKGDFNNDGAINMNDLLVFLAAFGNQCEDAGCMDPAGCNYDPNATFNLDFCEYPSLFFNCDGTPINDADGDGIPDELEVAGCTDPEACNYDVLATDDNGNCEVPAEFFNCDGTCINDADGDGICDELEVPGCTDPEACNYDALATDDNGYCEYPAEFFNCEGAPINDADGDGIPDELEVAGCTDPEAGNYNPDATDDNGSCTFGLTGSTHSCGAENVHNPDLVYGSVTDIDGNTYRTIVIGNQEWMAENLTVEHYANGDPIPNVTNGAQWANLSTGAWCYYNNDPAYECPYGKLYNWFVTIDARNVCPTGWHVPTDGEWTILTDYLGGDAVAGGKMKSTGTLYWASPNSAATNESGFSGLAGGYINFNSTFHNLSFVGYWWSSTVFNSNNSYRRMLTYFTNGESVVKVHSDNREGTSVRCLRD